VRFRRKATETTEEAVGEPQDGAPEATGDPGPADDAPAADVRSEGPRDLSETDVDAETEGWVDLTSLLVTGQPGLELRMQVDESTQTVVAVLFTGDEGAVELRPFAAPRSGGMWDEIRGQIAEDAQRRGATVEEGPGPFGPELRVLMPVKTTDGRDGHQPSRMFGIDGPRWFLRATLLGKPALDPAAAGPYVDAVRSVVVVRGGGAMAPGDPLPITVPPQARRLGPTSGGE